MWLFENLLKKNLFWVAAISPMICVVVYTFCVYITRADKEGVAIVSNKNELIS